MIISFSDDIFEINDPKLQEDLADIFSCIIEDKCLVDVSNLIDIFYDENGVYIFNDIEFAEKFLSTSKKLRLEDYINALIDKTAYLTDQHTKYLSSYKIGSKEEFISISEGLRLLRNPSKIILENAVNDWKFIQGIVDKYRNQKQRKSIYKLIERCITEGFLEAEQAGGKGQIRARIDDLFNNRYKNIGSKKIMALFDSDREDENDLDHVIQLLIEYLKGKKIANIHEAVYEEADMLVWHMLYKREAENYVPIDIILNTIIFDGLTEKLGSLSSDELDFIKYETYLEGIDVKKEFPDFFLLDFTKDKIEARCSHHLMDIENPNNTLEQVSEIEFILLKIAKII